MILSWGKPRIFYKESSAAAWSEMPTPAEGSTSLSTTKGNKTEAKMEGGENEAVRYEKSTYAAAFQIRMGVGRKKPITDNDGLVSGEFALLIQPEDASAPGIYMETAVVSAENNYSVADGASIVYTFDAEKPTTGHNQVRWGTIAVTESSGAISKIEFTELGANDNAQTPSKETVFPKG